MNKSKLEKLVIEEINNLPEKFRNQLVNIEIIVEDLPSDEIKKQINKNVSGLLLGLYQGVPLKKRGIYYSNVLPDKIIIFKKPIESLCSTEQEIKQKVRQVLLHEIGHYLGLEEKELTDYSD